MKLECQRCGKTVEVELSKSNQHVKATCSICGRYIKFVSREDAGMMQVFHVTDRLQGSGIVLQEYNGKFELVAAAKSRKTDGTLWLKWCYPQRDRKPSEKAIPWKLELGNATEAAAALKFFLNQLGH